MVSIQVAFVTASVADIDNLGFNFDLIPVSTSFHPAEVGADPVPLLFFNSVLSKSPGSFI